MTQFSLCALSARRSLVVAVMCIASWMPASLYAKGITIGSTGSINFGGGTVSLGCGDLQIDGELSLGSAAVGDARHVLVNGDLNGQSGALTMTGNWTNDGAFAPGSSAVSMVDGCATTASAVAGNTTFYDWSVITTNGKQLQFAAGDKQDILNAVLFNGAAGNLLQISSTTPGSPGFMELIEAGTQDVDYVDVRDNHALQPGQFMAPGFPEDYNSVDSGGNDRWFGSYQFTIKVYKDFNDGNPGEIVAHKECNTGLPLNASAGVSEGNPITFVTNSIDSGNTSCTVTETVPPGYSVAYSTEEDGVTNSEGCFFESVEQGSEFECFITNAVVPAEINVRKIWIDEHPGFLLPTLAEAQYTCAGVGQLDGDAPGGSNVLWFLGDDTYATFEVVPHWNGQTVCSVTEVETDSGVESDDSDCGSIPVVLGQSTDPAAGEYDCTIVNTRFYAGIPTLSRQGFVLLVLLMLGLGWVGLRRLS